MTTIRTGPCRVCGSVIIQTGRGAPKRICSSACKSEHARRRNSALTSLRRGCSVDGCRLKCRSTNSPYCEKHYGRLRRTGTLERVVREPNGTCYHCAGPAAKGLFCSPVCATRERIGADYIDRGCKVCRGSIEHASRWGSIYCGQECKRKANRWQRYGLSILDGERLEKEQGGKCAICRRDDERLVVDHCHATGRVRGLLCANCNIALGSFFDNVTALRAAVTYLETRNAVEHVQQEVSTPPAR